MLSRGKKALLALLLAVMAGATLFIIHTSRQAAQARENPNSRAAQVDRALQQVNDAMNR
jgi:hypothetical protein